MSGDADEELVRRAQALVGTVLNDKWKIERLIGFGGMAVVYQAIHRNKKRAAIKMLHQEYALDARIFSRFLREGYAANSVRHSGVVRIDDDDLTAEGVPFLVMELLEGETLDARRVRQGGRLSAAEVLPMMHQLLDVLVVAHEQGVVHRDLKPENLFLQPDGQLKVLDFGIARMLELRERVAQTQTGSLLGTPAFMAPEQARARWDLVDARTDLWAVGATLFTSLTGRYVHEAETLNEALALAVIQPPRPIASVLPDVHPLVAELVDRAIAYSPENRFTNARAMQIAIEGAYQELTGEPTPLRAPVSTLAPVAASTGSIDVPVEIEATLEPGSPAPSAPTPPHPMLATAPAVTAGLITPKTPRKRRVRWLIAGTGAVLAAAAAFALFGRHGDDVASTAPSAAGGAERPELVAPPTPPIPKVTPPQEPASAAAERELAQPSAKTLLVAKAAPRSAPSRPAPRAAPAVSASAAKKQDPFAKRR
jgi:eukaryotic-like serine/threonine-protein kinase